MGGISPARPSLPHQGSKEAETTECKTDDCNHDFHQHLNPSLSTVLVYHRLTGLSILFEKNFFNAEGIK